MRINWINHQGKKILFIDYSDIKSQDEMMAMLDKGGAAIEAVSGKVLVLLDMTGATGGPDFMNAAKAQGKQLLSKYEKSAVLGITGLKAMLLKGYNLFSGDSLQPFKTKEEALEYLCS